MSGLYINSGEWGGNTGLDTLSGLYTPSGLWNVGGISAAFGYNFLTSSSLPQSATFSRGTIGTLYNQSGLVAYAPANLLTFSQDFSDAAWNTTTTTKTTGQIAPDGSSTATLLTSQGSGSRIQQPTAATTGLPLVYSVYVKAGTSNVGTALLYDVTASTTIVGLTYNLNTVTAPGGTITAVGGGWYRVSMTATPAAAAHVVSGYVYAGTSSSIAGDSIYAWGAQIEYGNVATTYNPTTTTAYYGPRFDYDPNNVLQQNLILNSQTFNASPASWTFSNIALSSNVAQAPDGTNTASLITTSLVGSAALINGTGAALSIIPTPNTVVTRSFYLKYSFGNGLFYSEAEVIASGLATFDLVNITASATLGSATITAVGNGWYLCSHTYTTAASPSCTARAFYLQAYGLSTAAAGLFIWGFQFNYGSTALPYLATTSTAQTVCAPRGLLIEEARTNLSLQSQDFTKAAWSKVLCAAASNQIGVDGVTNSAQTITANVGTTVEPQVVQGFTAAAGAHTRSIYAKAGTAGFVALGFGSGIGTDGAWFNLTTGVVGTVAALTTATITYVGNGFYRCTITRTLGASAVTMVIEPHTADNQTTWSPAGTETIVIWGDQTEFGAFATSYIPTTSATVTRNFDNLSITSTNFASWFNQTTGTFAVQYDVGSYATTPAAFTVNPGAGFNANGSGNARWWNGSTNVITANAVTTLNTTRKEAMAYAASSRAICLNGGAVASDANVPFPGALTGMYFGNAYGGGTQNINGHIRSFSYYNYTLTNAQLQGITSSSGPPPVTGFNVLPSAGSLSYPVTYAVLSSDGTSYTVLGTVLGSSGTSYTPI